MAPPLRVMFCYVGPRQFSSRTVGLVWGPPPQVPPRRLPDSFPGRKVPPFFSSSFFARISFSICQLGGKPPAEASVFFFFKTKRLVLDAHFLPEPTARRSSKLQTKGRMLPLGKGFDPQLRPPCVMASAKRACYFSVFDIFFLKYSSAT